MNRTDQNSSETEQILHLKRLLVTLKEHYDKNIQSLEEELRRERERKEELAKEVTSLEKQHMALKSLLAAQQKGVAKSSEESLEATFLEGIQTFKNFEQRYLDLLTQKVELETKNKSLEEELLKAREPSESLIQ